MAFIYQYDVNNRNYEGVVDLTVYRDTMETVIREQFGKNLKEVYVERDFFEFRLYKSVSNGRLRGLGKLLKNRTSVAFGFRRRKQQLYLIVDKVNEETGMIDVDIVDGMIAQAERYRQRVERYFETAQIENGNIYRHELAEQLRNNLYLDVYSATVSKKMLCKNDSQEIKEGDCYQVQAKHRRIGREISDEERESGQLVQIDYMPEYNYLVSGEVQENENVEVDHFAISKNQINKNDEIAFEIQELLAIQLTEAAAIEEEDVSGKIIEFCVHNVGQALATSFAIQGEEPFMYFDYGLPDARNARTKPVGVNLPIKEKGVIVLSHLDTDHWNGLSEFIKAYKARWYIPEQRRGVRFNCKVAEIISAGGEVRIIPAGVSNCWGGKIKVSCSGISTIDSSRVPHGRHETGMAMSIDAKELSGNDFRILIEGDQDYDYVENTFLTDVDLLVACHHGGKYSWTVSSALPMPKNQNSCVIYSYGMGNIHRHPSKKSEHRLAGWNIEHDTVNGEYKVEIQI